MFYQDHAPPHFHALYQDDEGIFSILTLEMTEGNLPKRAKALVLEWAAEHRNELLENWHRAQTPETLLPIDPLG
jgi:hypothetical protein